MKGKCFLLQQSFIAKARADDQQPVECTSGVGQGYRGCRQTGQAGESDKQV